MQRSRAPWIPKYLYNGGAERGGGEPHMSLPYFLNYYYSSKSNV